MTINATKTVRDLATEIPGATRVFEKAGIDYCCGGGKTIEEACAAAGVSVDAVVRSLDQTTQGDASDAGTRWQTESLSKLTSYVVSKHHVFTREELERLEQLVAKVCSVHGQNHPELLLIKGQFQDLKRDLIPHMQKEEMILFPFIEQMDAGVSAGKPSPVPLLPTVQTAVPIITTAHAAAGQLLTQIPALTPGS